MVKKLDSRVFKSGKDSAYFGNSLKFGVKITRETSNLEVKSGDGRFKRFELLKILADNQCETRRGKNNAE
ncbi:MAG: hypothetical protein SR1Q5_09970 [Quinella sp. 1Q5]|nr:hypothetical protein [Quinella sp. 1Q5]